MLSLEDLTASIRSDHSRTQFAEAIRAYRAGAYRSATIALWIAVVQDIVEKLRTLADDDDANAKGIIDELDAARRANNIPKLQSLENSLLERACDDFELVTHREAEDLRRLYSDRNSCAHPTFQSDVDEPFDLTEEQVRAHARVAVDSLLAQPARVGKALVDRFASDVRSNSWPDQELTSFLRTRYFDRARVAAARGVLTVAVKVAIRPGEESNRSAGRCVAALRSAASIDRSTLDSVVRRVLGAWRDNLSDEDLARCLGAVGTNAAAWDALGPDNVARVQTLLAGETAWLIEHRAFASGVPSHDALRSAYLSAVDRLTIEELDALTRRPYPLQQWVEPSLSLLADARSFRSAEERLGIVVRLSSVLDADHVRRVGQCLSSNTQVSYAGGTKVLLRRLVEDTLEVPGVRAAWQATMVEYQQVYNPDTDPLGEYSYTEILELLT